MGLSERKNAILAAILKEHIRTAKAVGSRLLMEEYDLDLSSASIRNEMAELEADGYLQQPHTSAGRVPTMKAYQYYLSHFLQDTDVAKSDQDAIRKAAVMAPRDPENRMRATAKALAERANTTVIVSFGDGGVYYTGLTNLFHQPEFSQVDLILHLSEVVDRLDDVVSEMSDEFDEETPVLLGDANPFGNDTGALFVRMSRQTGGGLFGMVGPMRMPYGENLALLRYTRDLLERLR